MFRNGIFSGKKNGKKSSKGNGDPDYEEIGPQRNNKEQKNDYKENETHCDLCGSLDAAVRCDKCNDQSFCLVCDETYHGHPKRASHVRKTIGGKGSSVKPPLPPKGSEGTPAATAAPQPPPRKNKKTSGSILSTGFGKRKNDNANDRSLIGGVRKIMGNRPLPPPPDQSLDKWRQSGSGPTNLTRSSPSLNESSPQSMAVALPRSVAEMNSKAVTGKPPSSMPSTPSSAYAQYPRHQPRGQTVPSRKLSLQQFPQNFDDKRASMVDGNAPGGSNASSTKTRSQSVSDEQWNQMLVIQGQAPKGYPATGSEVGGVAPSNRGYNSLGTNARPIGRGMVSSASVSDLNSMVHQHPHQQQQHLPQHHHQTPHGYPHPNMHSANSFQQLSLMSYDPNMMWVQPSTCSLCQPPYMYPQSVGSGGMKRTASNISMNLSSVGSDVTGHPWPGAPHVHQHLPIGYPGYYPGCHQALMPPNFSQGSAMSIPDSIRSYNRISSSPAPSIRSFSQRSHKSSKSRTFSVADGGRRSRNNNQKQSEESDESYSSSISDDNNPPISSIKLTRQGGLAWQCDHCTYINPGHVHSCGMCSKVPGKSSKTNRGKKGNDRRKGDRRKDKKTDSADNVHNLSDYDNDNRNESRRDGRLKSSGSIKSSSSKGRKKSRRRGSSPSRSSSPASEVEDEQAQLEKQLRDLRLSSKSRTNEYDGFSVASRNRDKEKDRGSLKKEGGGSRYRNRRKNHSDRSMTPARSSPSQHSRRNSIGHERSFVEVKPINALEQMIPQDNKSSLEGTLIGTTASESNTLKVSNSKERANPDSNKKNISHSYAKCTTSDFESDSQDLKSSELEDPFDDPESDFLNSEQDISLTNQPPDIKAVQSNSKSSMKSKTHVNEVVSEMQDKKVKIYEIKDKVYHDKLLTPDNIKADMDEPPSFANTLDGIETMGTNEIADFDPNSQAMEDIVENKEQMTQAINALIPSFNYIERKSPEFEDKIIKLDYEVYEMANARKCVTEGLNDPLQPAYIETQVTKELKDEDNSKATASSRDPTYELIENSDNDRDDHSAFKNNQNSIKRAGKGKLKNNEYQTRGKKIHSNVPMEIESEVKHAREETIDDSTVKVERESSPEKEESDKGMFDLYSSDHSNEPQSPLYDRQHTPLSLSSSDAQFYSPPNSPDLSLSAKRRGRQILIASDPQIFDEDDSSNEEVGANPSAGALTRLPAREVIEGHDDSNTHQDAFTPQASSKAEQKEVEKQTSTRSSGNQTRRKDVDVSDEEEMDEKFLTVEQIIARRKQKAMKKEGLHLVQIIREAEELGYNPEEVSVAMSFSDQSKTPVEWLQENWRHMVETVKTLASNYGLERKDNDIGDISAFEAKKALRAHKGDIWAAVTECVEGRQKKYTEIESKGSFKREDIIRALADAEGNSEEAFQSLSKPQQMGNFFSKLWGSFMEDKVKESERVSIERVTPKEGDSKPGGEDVRTRNIQQRMRRFSETEGSEEKNPDTDSLYANVVAASSRTPPTSQDAENEIYANFVTPLLEKLGENLPRREEGVPVISEDLKKKIVLAILEGETEAPDEKVVFDSDEESTIEELLAVAENPTFYDYFTAVDLEDFEENSEAPDPAPTALRESDEESASYVMTSCKKEENFVHLDETSNKQDYLNFICIWMDVYKKEVKNLNFLL